MLIQCKRCPISCPVFVKEVFAQLTLNGAQFCALSILCPISCPLRFFARASCFWERRLASRLIGVSIFRFFFVCLLNSFGLYKTIWTVFEPCKNFWFSNGLSFYELLKLRWDNKKLFKLNVTAPSRDPPCQTFWEEYEYGIYFLFGASPETLDLQLFYFTQVYGMYIFRPSFLCWMQICQPFLFSLKTRDSRLATFWTFSITSKWEISRFLYKLKHNAHFNFFQIFPTKKNRFRPIIKILKSKNRSLPQIPKNVPCFLD